MYLIIEFRRAECSFCPSLDYWILHVKESAKSTPTPTFHFKVKFHVNATDPVVMNDYQDSGTEKCVALFAFYAFG